MKFIILSLAFASQFSWAASTYSCDAGQYQVKNLNGVVAEILTVSTGEKDWNCQWLEFQNVVQILCPPNAKGWTPIYILDLKNLTLSKSINTTGGSPFSLPHLNAVSCK